jgi:hypothetical protein
VLTPVSGFDRLSAGLLPAQCGSPFFSDIGSLTFYYRLNLPFFLFKDHTPIRPTLFASLIAEEVPTPYSSRRSGPHFPIGLCKSVGSGSKVLSQTLALGSSAVRQKSIDGLVRGVWSLHTLSRNHGSEQAAVTAL